MVDKKSWLEWTFLVFILILSVMGSSDQDMLKMQQTPSEMSVATTTPLPTFPCSKPCTSNGFCDTSSGNCICNPGWTGDRCHLCGGKVKLNSTEGWLADAVGNYSFDTKCTWLIEAPETDSNIRLHLKEFATECGWDHLYIFDGDSVFSDLLGVLSGMIRQDRYSVKRVPEIVGKSGNMLIHFYSDVAYNLTGFNITFTIDSCPSQRHDTTCSGHGLCVNGQCQCDQDFKGTACNVPACPQNCEPNGDRRGICNQNLKRCDCFDGWTGESCSQAVDHGYWQALHVDGNVPPARTAHAAMVDSRGRMWIVGGETFSYSHHLDMVATFSPDLINKDVQGIWATVHAKGEKGPSPRYGHSAVIHEDKIYMYGGTMRSGHVSRELWALDLNTLIWERVETSQGQCMASEVAKLCGPINSMGHTAHVVVNRMIVIFGHSPKYGYLDTVQEYHFLNKEWSILPTSGYPVRGGFGHSSVWDDITNRIYVYGGYVSTAPTHAVIDDSVYSLDPITKQWQRHTSSSSFRYLHSAVASHGLMIVFGGNTHNDTSTSHGAKCFSADILAYDMVCDKWYNLGQSVPKNFDADLPRFGHSATIVNGSMIIHGGFNGLLKNDTLVYVPGRCEMFKDKPKCLEALAGIKCAWNTKKAACEQHPPHRAKSGFETCHNMGSMRNDNHTKTCEGLKGCQACTSTSFGCVWCQDQCKWRTCQGTSESKRKGRFNSGFSEDNVKDPEEEIKSRNSQQTVENDEPVISKPEECSKISNDDSAQEWCPRLHTCHACVATKGCEWEGTKISDFNCRPIEPARPLPPLPLPKNSTINIEKPDKTLSDLVKPPPNSCGLSCSERTSCMNCTNSVCMWCKNLGMCIDRNAYLASFPFGQCMDWTTHAEQCPEASVENATSSDFENVCLGYQTCDSCRGNPSCGWCDNGKGTGIGTCQIGGASNPLVKSKTGHSHIQWVPANTCNPESTNKSWHFTSCPDCMCNGHSSCTKDPMNCDQPCQNNTEGEHCEKCAKGYFGSPVNGGLCDGCECNGQAEECHHKTGRCHCTTKGIIGEKCQKCDTVNHYFGNPKDGGSCYYDLTIDYQFTFNLSKAEDKHLRGINFRNIPTKRDVDVDFSITCSVPAKMNMTIKYMGLDGTYALDTLKEKQIMVEQNCTQVKQRFSKDDYIFGEGSNTTFYIHVYDFEPPLWIIISFSQHPKLDLLQFFITFSTCFLALLLIAAVLWKVKQKFDRYRRRQRLFVEMEQMASRPFGSVLVELEKLPDHHSGSGSNTQTGNNAPAAPPPPGSTLPNTSSNLSSSEHQPPISSSSSSRIRSSSSGVAISTAGSTPATSTTTTTTVVGNTRDEVTNVRRRRKRPRPSPIALEPCVSNRAAVLSLIVRMPTGGKSYAPNGYTGIAIASSLVTLGNPRKASTDAPSKQSLDDPKRKSRKGTTTQSTDI